LTGFRTTSSARELEHLGLLVEMRGKLEPLRGKLSKLADCGWLRKLPDGR
jgi:hypothetical protein